MSQPRLLPARYYAWLCDVIGNLGTDTAPLLAAAGISRSDIAAPDGRLSLAQIERLITRAEQLTDRSDLALELGRTLKLTSHSVVSYGILSSPRLGYCLRLVARYFSLIMPSFRMRYAEDEAILRLTVEPIWSMSHDCLVFHLELIAWAVHTEVREVLGGDIPDYTLLYSLQAPPHASRYDELREMKVHFGWRSRPGFEMRFPVAVASRQLALADPAALKLAEQQCSAMVNRVRHEGHLGDWVHMMLAEATGGLPSMEELAHTLNLSSRTLDRYMAREGQSFRQLSKQVRHHKACRMLQDPALPVTQIALELGYTDVSNFSRAFRRKGGLAPTAWRKARSRRQHSS